MSPCYGIKQSDALFSAALTTSSKLNFGWNVGTLAMRVENKTGSTRSVRMRVMYNQPEFGNGTGL